MSEVTDLQSRPVIPQGDADDYIRLIAMEHPELSPGEVMRRAVIGFGMNLTQAMDTARKYLGWDWDWPSRCVDHDAALPCEKCGAKR